MATFAIVGAGMMGSALTVPLVDTGHEVRLVGTPLDDPLLLGMRRDGRHPTLGEPIPESVRLFSFREIEEATSGVDAIGLGVSSAGVHWAAEALAPHVRPTQPIVMVTKGLEWSGDELRLLPDVFAGRLRQPGFHPVAIAGPCIAGELARRVQTCVVFAGRASPALDRLAEWMKAPYYHVRTTTDVVGAEVAAAMKNAYALGVALAAGIHESRGGAAGSVAMHNFESAVFAQAIVEMQVVIESLGGDPKTAAGLAGVGDLDVTCNGGRTGRFGRWLGMGLTVEDAVSKMNGATLESLDILRVFRDALPTLEDEGGLTRRELPLLDHLIAVTLEGARIDVPFGRFFGR